MNCIAAESKEIFNDGVLQAFTIGRGFVGLVWLTNQKGRLSKQAVKDLRHIEKVIMRDPGLRGWIYGSEKDHTEFHRLTEKIGARRACEDNKFVWFLKELKREHSNVR